MKVTFLRSEMDAESIAPPIDRFETYHFLTIITRAFNKLLNNEIRPFTDIKEI